MSDFVIELSALRKAFKGNAALDGVDLRVSRGSIFGFLGKNGAGKTTTMKVLMGLMKTTKSFELALAALRYSCLSAIMGSNRDARRAGR